MPLFVLLHFLAYCMSESWNQALLVIYIHYVTSIPVFHSENLCVEVDDVVKALFVRDGIHK